MHSAKITIRHKVDSVTREGLVPAIILLILPFVILFVLIKLLPPWQEGYTAGTAPAHGDD